MWTCRSCTLDNPSAAERCVVCAARRPAAHLRVAPSQRLEAPAAYDRVCGKALGEEGSDDSDDGDDSDYSDDGVDGDDGDDEYHEGCDEEGESEHREEIVTLEAKEIATARARAGSEALALARSTEVAAVSGAGSPSRRSYPRALPFLKRKRPRVMQRGSAVRGSGVLWTEEEDAQLLAAEASGALGPGSGTRERGPFTLAGYNELSRRMPGRSGNALRKRHRRLKRQAQRADVAAEEGEEWVEDLGPAHSEEWTDGRLWGGAYGEGWRAHEFKPHRCTWLHLIALDCT